ncbi:hypothetical protein J6590_054458 [Homalodisca vitripennis]|nr:hypothetical protein J6590_054458 [Homalodisca vitripennis]
MGDFIVLPSTKQDQRSLRVGRSKDQSTEFKSDGFITGREERIGPMIPVPGIAESSWVEITSSWNLWGFIRSLEFWTGDHRFLETTRVFGFQSPATDSRHKFTRVILPPDNEKYRFQNETGTTNNTIVNGLLIVHESWFDEVVNHDIDVGIVRSDR